MKNCFCVQMPLLQRSFVAFLLAFVAGALDAYAFSTTKSFASFQSGNVIVLIYNLSFNFVEAFPYLFSVLSFILGTVFLEIYKEKTSNLDRFWSLKVIGFEVLVLLLILFYVMSFRESVENLPLYLSWTISFVAGVQGNAFRKIGKVSYRNVAITSNIQSAFTYLVQKTIGKREEQDKAACLSMIFFLVLFFFVCGALSVVFSISFLAEYALLFALLPLSYLLFWGIKRRHEPHGFE